MNFKTSVNQLAHRHQVALACAMLERMLPNYRLFEESCEFGDTDKLSNLLNLCWQWVADHRFSFNAKAQQEKILELDPTLCEDDNIGVSLASDCFLAMQMLLTQVANKDAGETANIARISASTVARFLEYAHALDDEDAVLQHPLMEYEQALQQELLDFVQATPKLDKAACQKLKALSLAENMSNIGLEIS